MYNDTVIGLGVILLFLAGAGLLNFYEKRKGRRLFLEKMMGSGERSPSGNTAMKSWIIFPSFSGREKKKDFILMTLPGMIWIWTDLCPDQSERFTGWGRMPL